MAQSILVVTTNTYQMQLDVRARILQGYRVVGGVIYQNSKWYQQMVTGGMTTDQFYIVDESQDYQFNIKSTWMLNEGLVAQGRIILDGGRFIQSFASPLPAAPVNRAEVLAILNAASATDPDYDGLTAYVTNVMANGTITASQISDSTAYGRGILTGDSTPISGLSGMSTFGAQMLTANGVTSSQITDSTAYGRGLLTGNSTPISGLSGTSTFGQAMLTANGVTAAQITDATTYGRSILTGTGTPAASLTGLSTFGAQMLTANGVTSSQITDATTFGRSILTGNTLPVTALTPSTSFGQSLLNLTSLPDRPPVNQVFRASHATTGATISQNIAAANTPQAITFNTQTVPNAAIGTLNNGTGVFTFASAFTGDLELIFQVVRQATLLSAGTWACQVETSTDGVTWTPVNGSQRREFFQAISADQARSVALSVGISVAAGSLLRVTQMTDNVVIGVGVTSAAAAYGGTTTAGIIMSLYTTR